MSPLAVVILAAGEARRFGSAKQLAQVQGKPMLQHVLETCPRLDKAHLFVVLGAKGEEIQSQLKIDKHQIISNPEWQEGISSSVRAATKQLETKYQAILFVAGDQPLILEEQLKKLIIKWQESPDLMCAASYMDTVGVPAIFPQPFFAKLLELQGDRGAKKVLVENSHSVQLLEIPEAAIDIDHPSNISCLDMPI